MLRNSTPYVCLKALSAAALMYFPAVQCAAAEEQLVEVINQAGVEAGILADAESVAAKVFAKAGIELHWLPCDGKISPACGAVAGRKDVFYLQLLGAAPANLTKGALGASIIDANGGQHGRVYVGRVEDLIESMHPPAGRTHVLAYAMAHEIGHLLGIVRHSPASVMGDTWSYDDYLRMGRAQMGFIASDAARMREAVHKRAVATPIAAAR
jgi:hypothetical protein